MINVSIFPGFRSQFYRLKEGGYIDLKKGDEHAAIHFYNAEQIQALIETAQGLRNLMDSDSLEWFTVEGCDLLNYQVGAEFAREVDGKISCVIESIRLGDVEILQELPHELIEDFTQELLERKT